MATDSCGEDQVYQERKNYQLQGGYECIFVKNPPDHLQTECSVCLCVLREPYLVDCCGYSFCKSCIEPIKSEKKPCPLCSVEFSQLMPDKRLQRTLNDLQVYCSHKESGCKWMGYLGSLPQHLNIRPPNESDRLLGCQFMPIECTHCGENIQRQILDEHENNHCSQRPYTCEYCCDFRSSYEDVTLNHWPACSSRPVTCPNNCGASLKIEFFNDHLKEECPLEVINCPFRYAGCKKRLPRMDMPDHITQNLAVHMSLQAASHQQELKKLNSRITELEVEVTSNNHQKEALKKKVSELQIQLDNMQRQSGAEVAELRVENQLLIKKLQLECKNQVTVVEQELKKAQDQRLKGHLATLRGEIKKAKMEVKEEISKNVQQKVALVHKDIHSHIGLVPFTFTMPHFKQKRIQNMSWYGPSFYTHPWGYRMCVRIDANGCGDAKNTHVSLFLFMMKGEHDRSLKWPFQGSVIIELLDDLCERHLKRIINFHISDTGSDRVLVGDRSDIGYGFSRFIHHEILHSNFKDDCLRICVKDVNFTGTTL